MERSEIRGGSPAFPLTLHAGYGAASGASPRAFYHNFYSF
jgi:hypothetical protein